MNIGRHARKLYTTELLRNAMYALFVEEIAAAGLVEFGERGLPGRDNFSCR